MGSANKFSGGGCCCTTPAVATLNLTVWKPCSGGVGHAVFPSLDVNMVQGSFSVSGTTNGSGVAAFSLPATGIWAVHFPSPPAGYLDGTEGGIGVTLVAGANTKNAVPHIDQFNNWACQIAPCNDPLQGPFAIVGNVFFPTGVGAIPVNVTTLTGQTAGLLPKTGIFVVGTFSGTTWYGRFSSVHLTMIYEFGTSPTLSLSSSQNVTPSSATCGSVTTYPVGSPTHNAFEGTVHN